MSATRARNACPVAVPLAVSLLPAMRDGKHGAGRLSAASTLNASGNSVGSALGEEEGEVIES